MLVLSSLFCQSSTLLAQVSRRARVSGTPWLFTSQSPLSSAYNAHASESCWRLFAHVTPCALALDFANTGRSRAARRAMMPMTTRSSIKVKAKEEIRNPKAEGRRKSEGPKTESECCGIALARIARKLRGRLCRLFALSGLKGENPPKREPLNIQHPTSNIEPPMAAIGAIIGCWGFDVGCWMFLGFMGRLGVGIRLLACPARPSGHQRHLFWGKQPRQRGAAAIFQRFGREFAQAALLEHHSTIPGPGHQQRDQPAQVRLVTDE